MENLIAILRIFEQKREELITEGKWNEDAVVDCFLPCAKDILCNGYFLVNNEYIIDLGSIELYYHEEMDNGIKDHAMYHTNERLPKIYKQRIDKYSVDYLPVFYREIKKHNGYPYFKIGSVNLHQSGIDITFESEEKKYRASFLIRSYRMLKKEEISNNDILYDPCSSHLYEDMYNAGLLSPSNDNISIEWVENNVLKKNLDKPCPRRNLDMKPWRFQIEGLKEKEIQ